MNVVVFLGSRMARLESHGTRWRAVLTRWVRDPRVESLTVVDFPAFGRRLRVTEEPTWLAGARLLSVRTPLPANVVGPLDPVVWRAVARRIGAALGGHVGSRTIVAAAPLWTPAAVRLAAARRGFDAVDDWREHSSARSALARATQGYTLLPRFDVVTAVAAPLATSLAAESGRPVVHVGNGVDLAAYATPAGEPPAGLPDEPFAIYVGTIEQRVDVDLLLRTAERLPVVVAGPATGEIAERLRTGPARWLGAIPVGEVPALLRRARVGLLPHIPGPFTASMDPMKLLEYLAAGLPVVTTLPSLAETSPRVTAASPDAFAAAVADALARPRDHTPDPAVAERDWDAVAERLLRLHVLGEPG
ncbi:MAG TPA: glycosyltransferase [Mycobacteriales bacterium]|jgi:glycosyltransferase involved in cell wall biosynthesis